MTTNHFHSCGHAFCPVPMLHEMTQACLCELLLPLGHEQTSCVQKSFSCIWKMPHHGAWSLAALTPQLPCGQVQACLLHEETPRAQPHYRHLHWHPQNTGYGMKAIIDIELSFQLTRESGGNPPQARTQKAEQNKCRSHLLTLIGKWYITQEQTTNTKAWTSHLTDEQCEASPQPQCTQSISVHHTLCRGPFWHP